MAPKEKLKHFDSQAQAREDIQEVGTVWVALTNSYYILFSVSCAQKICFHNFSWRLFTGQIFINLYHILYKRNAHQGCN